MEPLTYDRTAKAVTYRSDTSDDPTAGTETVDPLDFLARVLVHIPDTGHETTRYDGWYANRPRGMRRQAEPAEAETPPAIVPALRRAPAEATRRWATLLQQIVEVDPLACSRCHGVMRLVACITPPSVIDQILAHRGARAATPAHAAARSPPSTRGPPGPGATRRPTAAHQARCAPAGPRGVGDRAVCPANTRPIPIEIPIPHVASLSTITHSAPCRKLKSTNAVVPVLRQISDASQYDCAAARVSSRAPPTSSHFTSRSDSSAKTAL